MTSPARWLHTVRWLRPVQVWGRAWFRLYRPRVDPRPAPALRAPAMAWHACERTASMTGALGFRFLGVERSLHDAGDWQRADWPRLWVYNLHYFDDLAATGAAARAPWHRALIARWITQNAPGAGTGWEPYPTSLRIVNWVKWALSGQTLDTAACNSLAVQARWLRRRLEIHLLGNHLWANAKALVFAGSFFDGDEAASWRAHGLKLIHRELAEQILADGGHFERSPMYHAIVLEDVLDLVQLAGAYPALFEADEVDHWRGVAARMLRWLRVMTHPDGGIALFNDAALDIAPDHAALAAYCARLGVTADPTALAALEVLRESGYVRMQAGPAVLLADVGEIGPDYLPGHAHADTLSFELSLHGARVLVNGGTSTYAVDAERLRQRGTAAHNTVAIDDEDSSEVWSSFRVARRARPREVGHGVDAGEVWLRAAHDGYMRLPGRPLHRREWRLSATALSISDEVIGSFRQAVAHLHVHPDWRATRTDAQSGTIAGHASMLMAHWRASGDAEVVEGSYHPRFGLSEPAQNIEIRFSRPQSKFTLSWE